MQRIKIFCVPDAVQIIVSYNLTYTQTHLTERQSRTNVMHLFQTALSGEFQMLKCCGINLTPQSALLSTDTCSDGFNLQYTEHHSTQINEKFKHQTNKHIFSLQCYLHR